MAIETRSEHSCWGGRMGFYAHASRETGTEMRFAVFVPSHGAGDKLPALYYLAGLTCTEETFFIKAGAQRFAAEHRLVLVACDTSPRGLHLPGEDDDWDFGSGAGFYLDATEEPWRRNYRMGSDVARELPELIEQHFPVEPGRRGIMGHSMGGHGALVIGLSDPSGWRSLSAIAPVANPIAVPWGIKAFTHYLGPDRLTWERYDASLLLRARRDARPILVDQGLADQFLVAELHPEALEKAAAASGAQLTLRRHEGYDHSYWFIQTVIADHIAWHAEALAS